MSTWKSWVSNREFVLEVIWCTRTAANTPSFQGWPWCTVSGDIYGTQRLLQLWDNPSASVTIHATLLWILLLTTPSLMNINNMGVAEKDLLLKNIMRNFLCSRVIWGDTDVDPITHAPVITKISGNTTNLIRNLSILLGLMQERGITTVRAPTVISRGKAVLMPYFPSQHSHWKRGSRIIICLSWQVCRQPRETHALEEWRDLLRLGRARVSELRAGSRHRCHCARAAPCGTPREDPGTGSVPAGSGPGTC